ncbi:MAG: hypothetical protein ABSG80_07895 [Verrucomicrobiota bacterium]
MESLVAGDGFQQLLFADVNAKLCFRPGAQQRFELFQPHAGVSSAETTVN